MSGCGLSVATATSVFVHVCFFDLVCSADTFFVMLQMVIRRAFTFRTKYAATATVATTAAAAAAAAADAAAADAATHEPDAAVPEAWDTADYFLPNDIQKEVGWRPSLDGALGDYRTLY